MRIHNFFQPQFIYIFFNQLKTKRATDAIGKMI